MSMWTYIVAAIDVDTYIESKTIKSDIEKLLEEAPRITGSERNADVFVNVLSGYNSSTNCDCDHCVYQPTVRHCEDGGFMCDAPEDYECPEGDYQTRVVITVIGDLRDRMKDQTKDEWNAFKKYIAKYINGNGFDIRNCTCKIQGW